MIRRPCAAMIPIDHAMVLDYLAGLSLTDASIAHRHSARTARRMLVAAGVAIRPQGSQPGAASPMRGKRLTRPPAPREVRDGKVRPQYCAERSRRCVIADLAGSCKTCRAEHTLDAYSGAGSSAARWTEEIGAGR